ncbi:Uncharacterised protein [Mycobacteroides abscessus subsp. abscessus]|nr:Uncharacterised protein [Mycobacteroides abscessus subsp. abscessus]
MSPIYIPSSVIIATPSAFLPFPFFIQYLIDFTLPSTSSLFVEIRKLKFDQFVTFKPNLISNKIINKN